jgi:hypothetical protein
MPAHSIVGPIAPYSNVPIHPEYYQPRQFFISNISLGIQTTVTTTVNHDYVIGQLVRLVIPFFSGCRELNHRTGLVLSIPSPTQVLINLNSSNASLFTTTTTPQQPQILAVGDVNNGLIVSTGRTLPIGTVPNIPGSFMDISP